MVTVKWDNGNYVTYQVSNGNWIVRDKTGHQIGIYTKGGKTARYLTNKYITNKSKTNNSSSSSSNSSSNNTSTSPSSSSALDNSTSTDDTDSSDTDTSNNSSGGHYSTTVEEVEIDNYYEALRFAYKYAHMILREDGHEITCKVIGGPEWRIGEWCKVSIPTFNEDSTMFITKVSTDLSASDENIASLTLVDYPPSLSSGTSNSPNSSSGSSSEDTSTDNSDSSNTNTTTTTTASNSTSKSTSKTRSTSSSRKTTNKNKNKSTKVNTKSISSGIKNLSYTSNAMSLSGTSTK